ncbi:RNA-splicing factor [Ceratobasidium sp. 392]|nr:RNA-splicing factor [Ceratobasidium sp. 392]
MAESTPTVPFFKKKARARPATTRQRSASPLCEAGSSTSAGPSKSQVVLPKKRQAHNPLIQGTKRVRTENDDGPDVQWRAGQGITREEAELELAAMDGEEAAEVLRKAARDAGREDALDDGQYHGQAAACAIKRFAKTPKCIACGSPTGGIFNRADKVIKKLKDKKAAKEAEAGKDSDEEGNNGPKISIGDSDNEGQSD